MESKPKSSSNVRQQLEIDDNKDDLDFNLQHVTSIPAIDNLQSLDDKSSIQNTDNNNNNSLPSTTQTISDSPQPSPTSNDFSILFEMMKETNKAIKKLTDDGIHSSRSANANFARINSELDRQRTKFDNRLSEIHHHIQQQLESEKEHRNKQINSIHEKIQRVRIERSSKSNSKASSPTLFSPTAPEVNVAGVDPTGFSAPRKISPQPSREHAFVESYGSRSLVIIIIIS
jgi:hypothetical protein